MIKLKYREKNKLIYIMLFTFILSFLMATQPTVADQIESGSNDLFEFEASIKESDIKDGSAPFDKNDEAGYDSGPNNGIVRTFDSITYPIKLTINPKKSSSLKNIKLRLSGEIKNGISDERVNAVFSNGNVTDMSKSKVTFEQYYTVKETGNSIMIPIVVEAKGAINQTVIEPVIKVEVISVDGVNVEKDKIQATFDSLPKVKISGKVNLSIKMGEPYGTNFILEQGINPKTKEDDLSLIHPLSVSINAVPLVGKSNMVGTTFPEGKINYHFEFSGRVDWDDGKTEYFNFKDKNKPLEIFGIYSISSQTMFEGSANTISEKLGSFNWNFARSESLAGSEIAISTPSEMEKLSQSSVFKSGKYTVEKPVIVENNKISVKGENTGFIIGSTFPTQRADSNVTVYNANQYAFSTQGFLLKSPNEYFPLYKLNKINKHNNVYYTVKFVADSYVDKTGKTIPLNVSGAVTKNERNNPLGSYHMQGAYRSHPQSKELGTPHIGDSSISKGDATVIRDQDVLVNNYLFSRMIALGGFKYMLKWNTDSFEMTKEYANETKKRYLSSGFTSPSGKKITNSVNHRVYFGVVKKSDNSFKAITENHYWDYDWFEEYDEAIKKGVISAILEDVSEATGSRVISHNYTFLKVKTKKIGSVNTKGTPNIFAQQAYIYPTKDRKSEHIVRKGGYKNPTEYDESGNMTLMQSPVGSLVNFDTLGIVNAELSSSVTSDKETYYTTDTIDWQINNTINVPSSTDFTNNVKVEIKQIIPKGLLYNLGSATLGNELVEPSIKYNNDGSTELSWVMYLTNKQRTIPSLKYKTSVDPLNLSDSIEFSLNTKSIISSEIDSRPESFRTSSKSIKVVKVGMVGIKEQLTTDSGDRNSSYELTIAPYTTIDDEANVKGISVVPYNGDRNGSTFSGENRLKGLSIESKKEVEIWVNEQAILEKNPNSIDLGKNGWRKIDSNNKDLSNTKTIFFFVKGILSKTDRVNIKLQFETSGNKFNDTYISSTSINSGTNYKLSPESNKVKYTIRADVELKMRKIQIFTGKSDVGLESNLEVDKKIGNKRSDDENITVSVYEKQSNKKVFSKEYKAINLPEKISFTIPKEFLSKNDNKSYEAAFENYNDNKVSVIDGYEKVDTLGYTSSEERLLNKTISEGINYKAVIMTERDVGKEMYVYFEKINIPPVSFEATKSGYGVDFDNKYHVNYTNELKKRYEINTQVSIDKNLVEDTLNAKEDKGKRMLDMNILNENTSNNLSEFKIDYQLPKVLVRRGDGAVYLDSNNTLSDKDRVEMLDGGNKLYIPIWIDNLGTYNLSFESKEPVGVNAVSFSLSSNIKVYAYMYATIGSPTIDKDELLLEPVFPETTVPDNWLPHEESWLKE